MPPSDDVRNVYFIFRREVIETETAFLAKFWCPDLPELDPICVMGLKAGGTTKESILEYLKQVVYERVGEEVDWSTVQ